MSTLRLISRLDIKAPNLIKGVHLEGLRVVGDPSEYARKYYEQGIDEIIYMDIVASLYGRNSLADIVEKTTRNTFVPITVGGGIRNVEDVNTLLRSGADKVAVNTAAVARPEFIKEIAESFGSQCMVLSIEAKRNSTSEGWEAYVDNGREHTGFDVVEWAQHGEELGAGEILVTSVDQEGTRRGFDIELIQKISEKTTIPVIASGGMGTPDHLIDLVKEANPQAVAMADILHFDRMQLADIRSSVSDADIKVRDLLS